ncbi:MAG: sigma-70 family RNA polymerase sigma factor [Phycisphaerae bacterium]|nr:sigma-70 family RNA polymerase sigma factor [Phycisphaerae bacterium]
MDDCEKLNQIITGCQNGDNQAFAQLIDAYSTRCYGYFYRLTGNNGVSDDLLSRLFMRLFEKISSFKGGSFEKWLFTIASNIFNDYLRHEYRQRRLLESHAEQLAAETPPRQSDNDIADLLQRQIGKLDEDTAELIMLRFYGELSFKELSDLRGEPIGTTLSKVHRGLGKLRELMGGNDA